MLEETILTLVGEVKRVADRLEMIHNHLVKLPEQDPQLDAKLIKEESLGEPTSSVTKPSKGSKTTGSKVKGSTVVAEVTDPDTEIYLTEEDEENFEELEGLEPPSNYGVMSPEELGARCTALLEQSPDKTAKAKVRALFVEVLKNTFGKEKTSELKPEDRKTFYTTFEKRVKEKK